MRAETTYLPSRRRYLRHLIDLRRTQVTAALTCVALLGISPQAATARPTEAPSIGVTEAQSEHGIIPVAQAPARVARLNSGAQRALRRDMRAGIDGIRELREALDYPTTRNMRDGTHARVASYLLDYDMSAFDEKGSAVISYGNPALADNVVIVIAGLNSQVKNMGGVAGNAERLFEAAAAAEPRRRTAVIAWQGYDTPNAAEVTNAYKARKGKDLLANSLKEYRSWNPSARLSIVAHSYGSVLTSHMIYNNKQFVQDSISAVAFTGSPGIGTARNAAAMGLRDGMGFVGSASSDAITLRWNRTLGADPASEYSGFARFKAERLGEKHFESSDFWKFYESEDHSHYFDTDTESLYSLASIVTGRGIPEGYAAPMRQYDERSTWEEIKQNRSADVVDKVEFARDGGKASYPANWRLPSIVDQRQAPDGTGDIGEDRRPDLVVAGTENQPGGVVNLYTYGSRSNYKTLARQRTGAPRPRPWDRLSTMDLNRDRAADLVVVGTEEQPGGRIHIYPYVSSPHGYREGNPIATWAPELKPWDRVSVLDLEGDGQPDLVVVGTEHQPHGKVHLYVYRSGRDYRPYVIPTQAPLLQKWDVARVADVDRDHEPDLVIIGTDRQPGNHINLYTYSSATCWQQRREVTEAPYPQDWDRLSVGNFDGDNEVDLIVIGADSQPNGRVNIYSYASRSTEEVGRYQQLRKSTVAPYPQPWDVVS